MKTDIQVAHPDIVFYDFYGAYNSPVAADKDAYLSIAPIDIFKLGLMNYAENRTGILAQVAPNLGPIVSASVYLRLIDMILTTFRLGHSIHHQTELFATFSGKPASKGTRRLL